MERAIRKQIVGPAPARRVFDYFGRARRVALGRLEHRFAAGPIDWREPYRPPPE